MNLSAYLHRIGFTGEPRPDLATLTRIHRLHLEALPYENIDVQLGRTLGFDLQDIYHKLVDERRGGWCYEMNGLMAWALEQIGFRLTRLAGAAMREEAGDSTIGTHLALCVHLDRLYLADVGFGDGLIEPTPIVAGEFAQGHFKFRLEQLDAHWWRIHNHPHGGAKSFDFQLHEALQEKLADRCHWLQTSPESGFVQNAVCQRYIAGDLWVMRGRVLKRIRGLDVEQRIIETAREYRAVLVDRFAIDLPDVAPLWDRVSARHEHWLRTQATRP